MTYRCALITGASSGIGAAFAHALPVACDLLLTGRDPDRLDALAADLRERGGKERRVETLSADLAQEEGRQAVISAGQAQPIDLLINNAGLGRLGAVTDNDPACEREMVEVNCLAPVVLTRALLPDMIARAEQNQRRAGLIMVASTAGFAPLPLFSTYAATKAFDLFYAEGLAGELARQPVDVLALCPGPTETAFFERAGVRERRAVPKASARRVAEEGLAALGRRSVHVVGGANRAYAMISRLLPKPLMRAGAREVMRRAGSA